MRSSFVESRLVTEERISQALARHLRIPFVDRDFKPQPVFPHSGAFRRYTYKLSYIFSETKGVAQAIRYPDACA